MVEAAQARELTGLELESLATDVVKLAVKAGAKVEMPLQNQFWGDRYGKIQDPFGHRWGLAQHIEEVSPAEMERRSAAWVAQMSKAAGGGHD